jgi:hypothetical protein
MLWNRPWVDAAFGAGPDAAAKEKEALERLREAPERAQASIERAYTESREDEYSLRWALVYAAGPLQAAAAVPSSTASRVSRRARAIARPASFLDGRRGHVEALQSGRRACGDCSRRRRYRAGCSVRATRECVVCRARDYRTATTLFVRTAGERRRDPRAPRFRRRGDHGYPAHCGARAGSRAQRRIQSGRRPRHRHRRLRRYLKPSRRLLSHPTVRLLHVH